MDLTWQKTLAQINVKIAFRWGVINGLNQGLSVHDVSLDALTDCYRLDFADSFDFFNLYAPQVWPKNATNAFIALHEGLDAYDLVKFPVDKFGPKNINTERIAKICQAYAAAGCRIDDEKAALQGQVYQRDSQVGYNDVGYDIWPTNYGRWIEQIDADVTSQGLFRIGGAITATSSKYARFARGLNHSAQKTGMYFKFSDGFFPILPGQISMHMIWYDNAPGSFQVRFVNQQLKSQTAVEQVCLGDKQWKEVSFQINKLGVRLSDRGSDFFLTSSNLTDVIVHMFEAARVL